MSITSKGKRAVNCILPLDHLTIKCPFSVDSRHTIVLTEVEEVLLVVGARIKQEWNFLTSLLLHLELSMVQRHLNFVQMMNQMTLVQRGEKKRRKWRTNGRSTYKSYKKCPGVSHPSEVSSPSSPLSSSSWISFPTSFFPPSYSWTNQVRKIPFTTFGSLQRSYSPSFLHFSSISSVSHGNFYFFPHTNVAN